MNLSAPKLAMETRIVHIDQFIVELVRWPVGQWFVFGVKDTAQLPGTPHAGWAMVKEGSREYSDMMQALYTAGMLQKDAR